MYEENTKIKLSNPYYKCHGCGVFALAHMTYYEHITHPTDWIYAKDPDYDDVWAYFCAACKEKLLKDA